jgi:hypothetical protein
VGNRGKGKTEGERLEAGARRMGAKYERSYSPLNLN